MSSVQPGSPAWRAISGCASCQPGAGTTWPRRQPLAAVETSASTAGPGPMSAAAGFTPGGLTAGYSSARGRSDYVFHGARNSTGCAGSAKAATADLPGLLSSAFDSPLITPGGKGRTDLNKMNINGGVGDGAVAKLCGADSVYAVGQYAATMPQQALARCGLRRNTRTGRYHPPSLKTIRRTIKTIDAHAADAALCAWLRQESAAGRVPLRNLARRRQDGQGSQEPGREGPAPLVGLRCHRRHRRRPAGRRRQAQRDHLLR